MFVVIHAIILFARKFTKFNQIIKLKKFDFELHKCADTIGTVLVPWAGHFQCQNIIQS